MQAVIMRELRIESRRPGHHWLRAGAAAALVAACAWWLLDLKGLKSGDGLFRILGKTVLAGLWVVTPWLTADCLAREKREGTLGLLFLTPLTPRDVIWGKAFLQSWRALVLVVATWPILALPVMMGGVGVPEVFRMLLLQLATLGVALAAGVAASALTERWWRARILAMGFTAAATVGFVVMHLAIAAIWNMASAGGGGGISAGKFARQLYASIDQWIDWQVFTIQFGPRSALVGGTVGWKGVGQAATVAVTSAVLVWMAGRAAAWGLARTWRRSGEGRAPSAVERGLMSSVAPQWGDAWKARWLAWAPLVWFERRSWSGRLGTMFWAGWAATMPCIQAVFFADWDFTANWGWVWRWSLVVGMAVAAAGRMRDGDGGAWEMLVVAPISRRRLAAGLWVSVLAGFAPAMLLVGSACVMAGMSAFAQSMEWSAWDAASLFGQSLMGVPPALAVVSLGVAGSMRGRAFLPGVFVSLGTVVAQGAILWTLLVMCGYLVMGSDWAPVTTFALAGNLAIPTGVVWLANWVCAGNWLWIAWREWRRTLSALEARGGEIARANR